MIKPSSLLVLTGCAMALAVATVFVQPPKPQAQVESAQRFYPQLLDKLNAVQTIKVRTADSSYELVKKDEIWVVPSESDYPADINRIKQVLFGLAELAIVEPKTANPDYYSKIAVSAIGQADSQSTELALQDESGEILAALLLGKERPSKHKSELTELFVRKPDEPRAWLVVGALPVLKDQSDWLNTEVLSIPEREVAGLSLVQAASGQSLSLKKASKDEDNFELAGLGSEEKLESEYAVNYVVSTLGNLSFEQVQPRESDRSPGELVVTASLSTFNVMAIDYTAYKQGEVFWLELSSRLNEEVVQALPLSEQELVKSRQAALQQKFLRWRYAIPEYQAMELKKTKADLVAQQEEQLIEPKA